MWDLSIRHRKLIGLLGIFGVIWGCVSTPTGYQTVMEERFRTAPPKVGTKMVVGGNHSGAVNEAIRWLNDRKILVVNRWVDQNFAVPEGPLQDRPASVAQKLAGAHKVGATLILLVQVEEIPLKHTNAPMNVPNHSDKLFGVKIQGTNAETDEMAFAVKAWNLQPLADSQHVVQDLTMLALEKAWQESQSVPSHQPDGLPQIRTEQTGASTTQIPPDPSNSPPVLQQDPPKLGESSATSEAQVTDSREPVLEEMSPEPVGTHPLASERPKRSSASTLGLQFASGALSILYTPLKVVYAGLGGLFGCLAYGLTAGNEQVAQSIWDRSIHGTYWLTPDHLQGYEPIRFKGQTAH